MKLSALMMNALSCIIRLNAAHLQQLDGQTGYNSMAIAIMNFVFIGFILTTYIKKDKKQNVKVQ